MDPIPSHAIGVLDASLSPMTALCFMVKNDITYLLGGSTDGYFWIYDMFMRKKLYQITLHNKIIQIHHHPTQWYEIITQESKGSICFWGLDANFQFVSYHTIYADAEIPRSVIANNHILFPNRYLIQMLNLDELKCIVPPKGVLCDLVDWKFGIHTALISIKINNESYAVSGYIDGSLIVREVKPEGLTVRFLKTCTSNISCMAFNQENQELVFSGDSSDFIGIIHIRTNDDGTLKLKMQQCVPIGYSSSILTIESRNTLLLCGGLGAIKIFNFRTSNFLLLTPPMISSINSIVCSPTKVAGWSNLYVYAVAYANGDIRFWTYDIYYD